MDSEKTIFISYANEDSEIAKKLYYDLKKEGFIPWIDFEDLKPGQNWKDAIADSIKKCSYFIALLSNNSISKRGYVQREVKDALKILDEMPPNKTFIIPLRIDDCKPLSKELIDFH